MPGPELRSLSWHDLAALLAEMCVPLDARGFGVPDPADRSLVATLERAGWARSASAEVGFAIATGRHLTAPVQVADALRVPELPPLAPVRDEEVPAEVRAVVTALEMTEEAVSPKGRPS